jgi:methylaspartate ammonia-lyase
MAKISQILTLPTAGAYYFDDLAALQGKSFSEAERYIARPITPGFKSVREPAEALAVGVVLENGIIGWGECTAVEFSAAAGRDPVFRSDIAQERISQLVIPQLLGKSIHNFRALAGDIENIQLKVTEERLLSRENMGGKMSRRELLKAPGRLLSKEPEIETITHERQLHTAIRYGVSQALFAAAAQEQDQLVAELICKEWNLPFPKKIVPIHAQCGGNRFRGAEKMIVRGVSSLPHALVDNIPEQLGKDAIKLIRYTKWLKGRINQLGKEGYHPTIHLDLHGGLGKIYDQDLGKVLGTLHALEQAAHPYPLRIECPVIRDTRADQIETLGTIREFIKFRKMKVKLVADEWANTLEDIQAFIEGEAADMIQIKMPDLGGLQNSIEAVLACKANDIETFLGGSCAETDLTARISAQVALALQPNLVLAKPGMGIDEGITIISNEMARSLAWLQTKTDSNEN